MRHDPGVRRGERVVVALEYQDPRDREPCELFVVAGRPGEVRVARGRDVEGWPTQWADLHLTPQVLDELARAWLASRGA